VVVARKIGVPFQPELALGAVTADGSRFTNLALVRDLKLSTRLLRVLADEQRAAARLSEERLRGHRPPPRITGRTVIVVDDGFCDRGHDASGTPIGVPRRSVSRRGGRPGRRSANGPGATGGGGRGGLHPGTRPVLRRGLYYEHFEPVSDDAVCQLLAEGIRSVQVDA
jgi:predicted phosphoribosyltransferase